MDKQMGRQTISERVRVARQRRGYSQRRFAKELGMTSGNWSKTENGKQSISMDLLLRINNVLGLDIRYYFGDLTFENAKRTKGIPKGSSESVGNLVRRILVTDRMLQPIKRHKPETEALAARLEASLPLQNLVRAVYYWEDWMIEIFAQTNASGFLQGMLAASKTYESSD